jgi:PAS domain S-box-containing protein
LEFRNLNSLFGRVLVTGEPMIANDPATHPQRGGLPPGHPPLNAFLGVPIWHGDELLAMAGVSNRPGGYDASLLKEIEPLMGTYAAIIRGFRFEKRLQEDKERIAALNHSLELRAAQLADALETNIRVERERVEALQEQSSLLEKRVIERTAELQSSQRQFEHLFEFAPDALFLTDDQGVIRLTNRAAEKMFGWSRDALLGKTLDELLTPSQRAIYQEVKSRPHSSGENTSIWGRKHDGSEFPLDLRISRLNIMGEQCLVTAMRDVSERNHLEHELSRISSHEQERISHELHDHLGAYLAGIAFRFKSLAERVKSTSTAEVDTIDELVGQVNSAIRQVRDFVRLLSPVDLESGGLPRGLQELGREMESVFDIRCNVQVVNDLPSLTLEQSMHLYRIAQEATRNAIQHGRAKEVSILLMKNAGDLQLVISNDGERWNPEILQARGMGLRIMRHRALSIGGTIKMDASARGNLVVSCLLPLPITTS